MGWTREQGWSDVKRELGISERAWFLVGDYLFRLFLYRLFVLLGQVDRSVGESGLHFVLNPKEASFKEIQSQN